MRIAIVGNFLPRRCGIATFTDNLTKAIQAATGKREQEPELLIVAMNDGDQTYDYPEIVKCTIQQQNKAEYLKAATFINESGADICIVQHEYGIYGGESGAYILSLMQALKIPVICTVHTVLQTPSYHERHILRRMGEIAQKLVVMSKLAVNFLSSIYQVPLQKIAIIHHGVPDFSAVKRAPSQLLNYPGKKVLSTFGFLGRSKGIETVINALPAVVEKHPDIVYIVLGQTHPNVKRYCGEEYRDYLKQLAIRNGVENHVVFEDGFYPEEELKNFLLGLDIYITPYLNEGQITSGTISYAVGAGSCIVSTPFWHAKELLADGRGCTFGFGDSDDLANVLNDLLDHPERIEQIKEAAFEYGKKMYWNRIGQHYRKLMEKVLAAPVQLTPKNRFSNIAAIPRFSLDHIRRLTDDFGIVEHANYSVPDYKEGYCLDDNARALLLVLTAYELGIDKQAIGLADTYLRYIKLMQLENGYFHNDFSYDRRFMDEVGSEDSFGRTIWAMGYLIRLAPNDSHFQFAKDVFFRAMPNFESIQSIRAIANIIIGICNFLKRYPDNERVMHILNQLTSRLIRQYRDESEENWDWFEPILCYDNAIIPLALWYAYAITRDRDVYEVANATTNFLDQATTRNGHVSLVGNTTWYKKGEPKDSGGQQPIDAMAMVMMHHKAFLVTKESRYYDQMMLSFSWFLGNNDLGVPLYDEQSKGCCDGLEIHSVNRNQGAESTISYQLSYLTVWSAEMEREQRENQQMGRQRTIPAPVLNNVFSMVHQPAAVKVR